MRLAAILAGGFLLSASAANGQSEEGQVSPAPEPPQAETTLPEVVVEATEEEKAAPKKEKSTSNSTAQTVGAPVDQPSQPPTIPETAWGPVDGYAATRTASGTKTDTAIMDLPASVQVVPREVISDQAARNLKDLYKNFSGVQQAGNTLNAQSEVRPFIRGFESDVLLRNGLRSTESGTVDLINVERVEVLKGPASILYGALEPGGVINYVTKRPQNVESYEIEQEFGSYEYSRTTVDLTGPMSANGALSYRFNAAYTNSDSFREFMELERTALAPSFLLKPTSKTEVLLDFAWTHETQPYDTGIPITADGKPLASDSEFVGDPTLDGRDIDDYLASVQISHEINSIWSVRNQLQFHRADAKNETLRPVGNDNSVIALRYQDEDRRIDEYQGVLDATAKFTSGKTSHTVLLGSDVLYQEETRNRFRTGSAGLVTLPLSGDLTTDYDPPPHTRAPTTDAQTVQTGLYAQDQVSVLADGRLKVLLGGRYDMFRLDSAGSTPDIRKEALTGRLGILYKLTDEYSVYASASESFNPHLAGVVDQQGTPLDPEEGLQYEAGIKKSFFDERLIATASIYQITKENVELFDEAFFAATGQIAYLPGIKQQSRGFEFNLTGALTQQVDVIANYAYTDTEILENPGDPDTVGGPIGGTAPHTASVWLTYAFAENSQLSGLKLGGGVSYVGHSTAEFDTGVTLDPYVVVDAAAWYDWENLRFGLNVKNLLDEEYIERASTTSIAHPGEPLTVIGSIRSRF